jgi:hypothetical protein
MVVILIKTLKDFGIRTAVCGTDDFVRIWETTGRRSPAPAETTAESAFGPWAIRRSTQRVLEENQMAFQDPL